VALSGDELTEMRMKVQSGELPSDAIKRYYEEEARTVYGVDAKKRRDGSYIEQGHGSAHNQTRNSIEAYRKYGSAEPEYEKNLARMQKELAEADARRAAERGTAEL
jgi:hypothetical protein